MQPIEWTTEKRKVLELIPYQGNPRQLTEKQAKDLSTSLERFNLADPIVINTDNTIIGGHQRVSILKQSGDLIVDVRVPSRTLTKDELLELNLRLNRNQGQWDFDLLANLDEELLTNVGFESKELDRIFQLNATPEDDELPPERADTGIVLGDLYQLGQHRLLCGDATKREDVEKLMQGEPADMVFTDPPYNVDYQGMQNSKQWDVIANDMMSPGDFEAFLIKAFTNFYDFSFDNAACYICHADKSHKEFRNAFEQVGYEWRATIIWVKNSPAFNFAQYKYKHEPIFYCYKKGKTVNWYGDRTQNTVWEAKKEVGEHPTIKPVELITKTIENSSLREGIVMDLFGGSGSTLIACEKTSRKCRMMEISPVYCQVIIDRWEKFTGKKAVQLNAA
jgi:DNA modification methylase